MSKSERVVTPRTIIMVAVIVLIVPLLPILITGRWGWWQAWVFAAIYIFSFVISRIIANRRNPGIIAERAYSMELKDAKPWDRVLSPAVALGGILVPLTAGLDVRIGWSPPFSLPVQVIGLAGLLAGIILGAWALIENAFFSGVVRIQTDRGQHVVMSGPYALIRHPGYAGAILTYLATPFLLDSWCALGPAAVLAVLLIVRTNLEDHTLRSELDGYGDYAKKVRFRILPGVW